MTCDELIKLDQGLFLVPPRLRAEMRAYLVDGRAPGSALTCVLEGDERTARMRAGPLEGFEIDWISDFLRLHAPAGAYGSPGAVSAWLEEKAVA